MRIARCSLLCFATLVAQAQLPPVPIGYEAEPGGTPEDRLWQVLVLFGATADSPAQWSGRVSMSGGAIHAIEPYRFELPDKLLPGGGLGESGFAARERRAASESIQRAAHARFRPPGFPIHDRNLASVAADQREFVVWQAMTGRVSRIHMAQSFCLNRRDV